MAIGVGGSTPEHELSKLSDRTQGIEPISKDEFAARIDKARRLLVEEDLAALYLHAGTNLYYFTGLRWSPSERMAGVLVTPDGGLDYISPGFERGTFKNFMRLEGAIHGWEEHQSPYELFGEILAGKGITEGKVGLDESTPFFATEGFCQANPSHLYVNAESITAGCRMFKSAAEIALLQRVHDITLEVLRAAARILHPGISTNAVVEFIHEAHVRCGIPSGSYFCIVLFGEDSQYPHGVSAPRDLRDNEVVLVDTGCQLEGYISDITRTYVYGTPSNRHREIWNLEKAAQKAAFEAAQLGSTCSSVDTAAREVLAAAGLSPDYELPGLPHRVGHGTGLDIHEHPYLMRSDFTVLQPGMVVSNEPMICLPGEFGMRHEDHFYMTDAGPRWFTEPMASIDDPFGEPSS
jgi:Xaa-Pro dipeptidase